MSDSNFVDAAYARGYAAGVEKQLTLADIKRAFMEGVIALAEEQKNPAPQWMVERLWVDSHTLRRTARALQTS